MVNLLLFKMLKYWTPNVTKNVIIEVKILALLKENASTTTTEMEKRLFVNRCTVQRGLNVLKDKGIIERKGDKRYGFGKFVSSHYTITR